MQAEAIVLASRPIGDVQATDFATRRVTLPGLNAGQVLVETRFLSIDPYLRGLLDERPFVGLSLPIGATVPGRGLGIVLASESAEVQSGDVVAGELGWQTRAVRQASELRVIAADRHPLTWRLGVLGTPGVTALLAIERIATPVRGEVFVVSSAAGTVGSSAGQIARSMGCRIVGIAGGKLKTDLVRTRLGFDGAVDYKTGDDFANSLADALPDGADVYFDNVGGSMLNVLLPSMRAHGRVVVCGFLSGYGQTSPEPLRNATEISTKRLRVEGFSVRDHQSQFGRALEQLTELADRGELIQLETISRGLASAPEALDRLLRGEATGKMIVDCG